MYEAEEAAGCASALGSSAAVVVWRMFHTWREKSYTDVVLALLPNVDEEMFIDLANAIRDDSVGVGWSNLELLHRRLDETIWHVVETIAYTLAR